MLLAFIKYVYGLYSRLLKACLSHGSPHLHEALIAGKRLLLHGETLTQLRWLLQESSPLSRGGSCSQSLLYFCEGTQEPHSIP